MLPIALIVLAGAFALLFLVRVSAARRTLLLARWPAVLFAGAAFLAFVRGALWPGLMLAALAAMAWLLWPRLNRPAQHQHAPAVDPADVEACTVLGVSLDAGEQEIRRAYRAKIARAHPDRGGGHAEAARLTAARDRLLRRGRG